MKRLLVLILSVVMLQVNVIGQVTREQELDEASKLMMSVAELFKAGKYKDAIPLAQCALEIRERLLPADNEQIDDALNYLGQLYLVKQDAKSAKPPFERLLARREARLGPDDPSLIEIIDTLAIVYFRLEDNKAAEMFYRRSLKIREQKFGAESAEAATGHYYLGEFYRSREDFSKSLDSLKTAVLILHRLPNARDNEVQRVANASWCAAYMSRDRFDEIKKFFDGLRPAGDSGGARIPDIQNGKALMLMRPEYPAQARSRQLEGKVLLKILIDEEGKVIKAADACGSPPILAQASADAVFRSRFSPTLVNGVPIKVSGFVFYRFALR